MAAIIGYQASVQAATEELDAAKGAMARDFAEAVPNSGWGAFVRDKYDLVALMEQIRAAAQDEAFRSRLHAAGDKLRLQSRQRGRPPKAKSGAEKNGAAAEQIGSGATI